MEFREVSDHSEASEQEAFDSKSLERTMKQAEDIRPGTFRYSDAGLGGEVRTSTDNPDGIQSVAKAEVFRRDGSSDVVGTARYSVAGGEAKLYGGSVSAPDYATEDALLSEIGDQSRARGADRLSVFVPDGDQTAANRWSRQGFQPATERDPDASGTTWTKRL